ncbi:hypothetical protein NM688_g789 [Phlebia brevispora]|uniref:Uncharacterized protein n=1 Tax=Phlebia brevispora TaxID=194682 RepID=A0ACC1TDH5_9APHY|nr:hypothetical protein NM688_g789 [Phlebia brevispora]
MSDSRAPNPPNVVLPGFQETFSDVLRRYPVEAQRGASSSSAPLDSREADIRVTRHVQYSPTCSPTTTPETRKQRIPAGLPSNSSEYQRSLNAHLVSRDSASSINASMYRITPDRASQHEEPESSEGIRVRKKHICHICDKDFLRPSSLETHMNSHTGAKPHKCTYPGCEKYFSAKSNMKRHLRKHLSPDDGDNDPAGYESTG